LATLRRDVPSAGPRPRASKASVVADDAVDQAFLTTLTTEHFTLAGARSQTVSEAGTRAALYLGTLSSALISLGFVSQVSAGGELFKVFCLIVLPTVYVLGLFTHMRLVESSVEDLLYGRAINRIRHYYLEVAGERARYFVMSGNDDVIGVLRNMGLGRPSRLQLYFTASAAIAVVNSVVGGTAVGFAVGIAFDPALGVSVLAGAAFAIASLAVHMRVSRGRHVSDREMAESLFPSPAAGNLPADG
jgi:hypothetical protein